MKNTLELQYQDGVLAKLQDQENDTSYRVTEIIRPREISLSPEERM